MSTDSTAGEKFQKTVEIMARLRAPGGCPWDREQTFDSIKPYTLEETYEVLDAIDRRDWNGLAEELGDFLLQAVFYAQMGAEQDLFRVEDALDAINQKLIRRHPHVFGGASAESAGVVCDELRHPSAPEAVRNWMSSRPDWLEVSVASASADPSLGPPEARCRRPSNCTARPDGGSPQNPVTNNLS